jgi:hypothetical protein
LLPANRSPLEVLRYYQQEIKGKGGRILFECKAEACGGDANRGSSGGGGEMSLAMYLFPEDRCPRGAKWHKGARTLRNVQNWPEISPPGGLWEDQCT